MADGELGAVFKGLAEDADQAAGNIAKSAARISDRAAEIEESNLSNTLRTEAQRADAFTNIAKDEHPRIGTSPGGQAGKIHEALDPPTEPATVNVWRDDRMPKTEFQGKVTALRRLSDDGKLYKATNPVDRDPNVTKDYRQNMIDRIYRQYNEQNPEFSNKLIDRVTRRMSPDHVHELQLGGPDTPENLKFLDRYTNEQIGMRQIWPQIKNLPDGTPIRIRVIDKK
ncbi:MAG TPA: hypothetical protein VEO01_31895 [Pseudonocardiaceae bacterium]|nr:hypothetical protein [Pseudonocardiaceae bacterium]